MPRHLSRRSPEQRRSVAQWGRAAQDCVKVTVVRDTQHSRFDPGGAGRAPVPFGIGPKEHHDGEASAPVHRDQLVAGIEHYVNVVFDKQDRDPELVCGGADHLGDFRAGPGAERGGRLIQAEHGRPGGQDPRQRHARVPAEGQVLHSFVEQVADADECRGGLHNLSVMRGRPSVLIELDSSGHSDLASQCRGEIRRLAGFVEVGQVEHKPVMDVALFEAGESLLDCGRREVVRCSR